MTDTTNVLPGLEELNASSDGDAREMLRSCCGSLEWARQMAGARPFPDVATLLTAAGRIWSALTRDDWLEALRAHPRIGGPASSSSASDAAIALDGRADRWSGDEQAGVRGAADDVLDELATANRRYEERFGHMFIVCATGKRAPEMLDMLHRRLPNEPGAELCIAAAEQLKITRIRLEQLAGERRRGE